MHYVPVLSPCFLWHPYFPHFFIQSSFYFFPFFTAFISMVCNIFGHKPINKVTLVAFRYRLRCFRFNLLVDMRSNKLTLCLQVYRWYISRHTVFSNTQKGNYGSPLGFRRVVRTSKSCYFSLPNCTTSKLCYLFP